MKVRCSHCNAAFAVDDAKVTGKKFAFDCPKCGNNVVIDNRARDRAESSQLNISQSLSETKKPLIPGIEESDVVEGFSDTAFVKEEKKDFGSTEEDAMLDSEFNEFEDELEPEIDLSVLQNLAGAQKTSLSPDEELLSQDFSSDIVEEDLSAAGHTAPVEDITGSAEEDESLTIDLNSLDIDLAEPEEVTAGENVDQSFSMDNSDESERLSLPVEAFESETISVPTQEDEDESLTLDLDSLDIPLDESSEIKEGERIDDDSRLSLDDAGLSIDDVERSEEVISFDENVLDSGINIGVDEEIERPFSQETISEEIDSFIAEERPLSDTFVDEKLPEIDIDRFGASPEEAASDFAGVPSAPVEDQFLDIESRKKYNKYEEELKAYDAETIAASGGGYINFSIDYSFHYSRLWAFLRLIMVYYITFIPYYIIGMIYSVISGVVGALNQLLILFSGKRERDFSLMQEQTLRFLSSLYASLLNVVEEKPSFGGKKNIDYQLQMHIIYPPKYSRILAVLRMSVVGILLVALPHILLLSVLTVGMSLISFVSLVYTIIAGRWPSLMFDFMVRYLRYWTTIYAYLCGLIDTYPSFRFE